MVKFRSVHVANLGKVKGCLVCGVRGALTMEWPAVRVNPLTEESEGWWCPACMGRLMKAAADGIADDTDLEVWAKAHGTCLPDLLGAIAWSLEVVSAVALQAGVGANDHDVLSNGMVGTIMGSALQRQIQLLRQGSEPSEPSEDEALVLFDGVK